MYVRMYNCEFGDCFKIDTENRNLPLYVDFGIHRSALRQADRYARYEDIIADMPRDKDFLLTHYHEDHYEGVIYAKNHGGIRFRNVYIPDIWNLECSVDILDLILLRGLLTRGILQDGVTLFDFLMSICNSKIHFVGSMDSVQEQYTVLWPDRNRIIPYPDIHRFLVNRGGDAYSRLHDISTQLRNLVVEAYRDEDGTIYLEGSEQRLAALRNQYIAIEIDPVIYRSRISKELSDWENDISIVFHSKNVLDMNVLFCGDVPKKFWNCIINNRDADTEKIEFEYDAIKVPHHGTKNYYYDFSRFAGEGTHLLIPNGNVSKWKIYHEYSVDATLWDCNVICSDNNCCEASKRDLCNCRKKVVLEQMKWLYEDI